MLWAKEYGVQIEAVDLTPLHVDIANIRIKYVLGLLIFPILFFSGLELSDFLWYRSSSGFRVYQPEQGVVGERGRTNWNQN
jgi:hypothetical protein